MKDESKYLVEGFMVVEDAQGNRGSSADAPADTMKEAKAKARHFITENYAHLCETSTVLMYARVTVRTSGECKFDCFHKDHPPEAQAEGEAA